VTYLYQLIEQTEIRGSTKKNNVKPLFFHFSNMVIIFKEIPGQGHLREKWELRQTKFKEKVGNYEHF